MNIAYLDCFSGISGDMLLGAFIDCGVSLPQLKKELRGLPVKGYELSARRVQRGHLAALKADVHLIKNIHFRNTDGFFEVIDKSKLDSGVKQQAKDVFAALAKAEAKVHKQTMPKIHFHQLGDLDTLIDIVGCVCACRFLEIDKIYASAVRLGGGKITCGRETFPLPAPAALELLKNRTIIIDKSVEHELATPTGAALLAVLSRETGEMPPLKIRRVGCGAGSFRAASLPNVLRVVTGTTIQGYAADTVTLLEANIDDMPPLYYEVVFERLFAAGALDVYTTPVMMKKMRPGILLTVLAEDRAVEDIIPVIFAETTTLGIRLRRVSRRKLERKILNLKTDYGIIVGVKAGFLGTQLMNIAPEYEDCKKISRQKRLPFKVVYERIKAQAQRQIRK